MNLSIRFLRNAISWIAGLSVFVFLSCHLGESQKAETTISFTSIFDSLTQYDTVTISLKNAENQVIDIVFKGKVEKLSDVENLPAPHWDGGKITVAITGTKNGIVVYRTETPFDGVANKRDSTIVYQTLAVKLIGLPKEIQLIEGDSFSIPKFSIEPAGYANKDVDWSVTPPEVLTLGASSVKATRAGIAQLTVSLKAEPTVSISIKVVVLEGGKVPESLAISPDSLIVAANGAPASFTVQVYPSTAISSLAWKSADSSIATVSQTGSIQGLKAGSVSIFAQSSVRESVKDSAIVIVTAPVVVEQVAFAKDSTEIFIGGAAESLLVAVKPVNANPSVTFTNVDPAKLELKDGKIKGLAEGITYVVAVSISNPDKSDTLKVKVSSRQVVDSVRVKPKQFTLYTGGDDVVVVGTVHGVSVSSKLTWYSSNPGFAKVDAAGKVSAVAPGKAKILAVSSADSLKKDSSEVTVKTDAPVVSIGQDTTVSVGTTVQFLPVVANQEFGLITGFRWDLNGDNAWDDSSAAVKQVSATFAEEKETVVRFYVRDTERNETIVSKKVRAVKGPVVLITAPLNNSYSRTRAITVAWSVNGVAQDSLKTETLAKEGANLLTRIAKDAAGTPFSTSITVYFDSVPPAKPLVKGSATSSTPRPSWTWTSGGAGGNGNYQVSLDVDKFDGVPETKDSSFSPLVDLAEGTHTLYVRERDQAGNWSVSGSLATVVDISGPSTPDVKVNTLAITNVLKPTFSWKGMGGGNGNFQYKFDNGNFATGATSTTDLQLIPDASLLPGLRTFYVRERDDLGNWSLAGSVSLTIDTTAPPAPILSGNTPTSNFPEWNWVQGSAGAGSGTFRFKIGGDGNPAIGGTETQLLKHALTSATTGTTYTLYIQEKDAAGNWSAISNRAIVYDLSKPSVKITAPLESGTFITKLASIGMTVSAGGKNAISKVTFVVGSGAPSDATPGTAGIWTIPAASIPLVNQEIVEVTVTAIDVLNNTGSAKLSILRDNNAPSAPTGLSIATTPTNNNKGSWSWSAGNDGPNGSGLSGNYRYNFGGSVWTTITTGSVSNLPLNEGSNTFFVQEQDNADNWSTSASNTVVVDIKPPAAVTFVGSNGEYTASQTPTWSWNPSTTNGGIGTYVLKLDSDPEFDLNTTTYTPTKILTDNQTHILTVTQRDQVAGVVGTPSSFSYKVKAFAAAAPTVKSDANVPNNGLTNNPKFTWVSGGGGNGTYRVSINNTPQPHPQGPNNFQTEWSVPSSSGDGTFTIKVEEYDQLGRLGSPRTFTIQLDRTGPTISNIKLKGPGYDLPDNFITNKTEITVAYTSDGTPKEYECKFSNLDGVNNCDLTGKDALGNSTTLTRKVYCRKHVIFLTSKGSGNGSSWQEATSNINILGIDQTPTTEFWFDSGDYTKGLGGGHWATLQSVSFYGGFSASQIPVNKEGRSNTGTVIHGWDALEGVNATYDKLLVKGEIRASYRTNITINDCTFESPIDPNVSFDAAIQTGGILTVRNIQMVGQVYEIPHYMYHPYLISILEGGTATFENGSIVNNTSTEETSVVIEVFGKLNLKGGLSIFGNNASSFKTIDVHPTGELVVDQEVNFSCAEISNFGGKVSCQ